MKLYYNRLQVQRAAEFIWLYNPSLKDWPIPPSSPLDIVDQILAQAKGLAFHNTLRPKEWLHSIGTGGFTVICTSGPTDSSFDIDVYVDASVKDAPIFVSEYIGD